MAAPVSKTWKVVGEEFANVDQWASAVPKSSGFGANGQVTGRTCTTPIGNLKETITHYDPENHVVAYNAQSDKIPGFVKNLSNRWQLTPISENATRVDMRLTADLKPGFKMMWPIMKKQFTPILNDTVNDLKYFVENDTPSPKKRAQIQAQ